MATQRTRTRLFRRLRIGIDLGGTKIELVALDESGKVLRRRRRPTPQGDYLATIRVVAELIAAAEDDLGGRGSVGIGIPGAESAATGHIKNANSTCLIGRPLRDDLQGLLEREVRLANDANCFALSEAIDGAGRGAEVVFGVILGTGVGGGIVVNQRVLTGVNRKKNSISNSFAIKDNTASTLIISEEHFFAENENCTVEKCNFDNLLPQQVDDILYQKKLQSVIIEGGKQTLQSFIDANLWDEARLFSSPVFLKNGLEAPLLPQKLFTKKQVQDDELKLFFNYD